MKGMTSLLDQVDPSALFTPFTLAGAALSNRFVMAPMTREFSPRGIPTHDVLEYYRRRARHFGLLITEGTLVDHPSAGSSDRVPHMYGDEALASWRRVVDAVHAEGGRIMSQLWHLGAARTTGAAPYPHAPVLSPSGIGLDGSPVGQPATSRDIDSVIDAYARSAANAKKVGFDGVEIHAAHGYFLDQFLWGTTNRRNDQWGDSLPARARMSAEVVAAVRHAVGPEFPIVLRFSQWKATDFNAVIAHTPEDLESLLGPIVEAGISGFHASTRRYWLPAFEGDRRTLGGWTKKVTGLPTIVLGSIGISTPFGGEDATSRSLSLKPLLELWDREEFDLVAVGRAALSDPEWPTKVRTNRLSEIRPFQKGDVHRLW